MVGEKIAMIWLVALMVMLPMGGVTASNISYDTDTSTSITATVQSTPTIQDYDLNDTSNNSMLNSMLDVNTKYHFYVKINLTSGWDQMKYVNVTAWYDNNDDSQNNYDSTTGENLKFKISYDIQANNGNGAVTHEGNINNVYIWDYTKDDYTHVVDLYFTMGYQMRHADMPVFPSSGPGWNDAGSWNFEISAVAVGGTSTVDDEFGIYKYTYIVASGNPSITTTPGTDHTSNIMSPGTSITFRTNDQFRIKVDINDLTSGSNTLAANNVWVKSDSGDVTTYTQFQDGSTPVYLYGSSSTYHAAYSSGNEESDTITWAIDVPLGTNVGTYTSPVTYTIEQP